MLVIIIKIMYRIVGTNGSIFTPLIMNFEYLVRISENNANFEKSLAKYFQNIAKEECILLC